MTTIYDFKKIGCYLHYFFLKHCSKIIISGEIKIENEHKTKVIIFENENDKYFDQLLFQDDILSYDNRKKISIREQIKNKDILFYDLPNKHEPFDVFNFKNHGFKCRFVYGLTYALENRFRVEFDYKIV